MKIIAGLTLAALLLTGCGGSSSTSVSPAPLTASAKTPEGLTATIAQPSAIGSVNSGVQYTMTLKNETSAPVSYQGSAYDGDDVQTPFAALKVYNADGSLYYPTVEAAVVPPPTHSVTITLQPGQSQSQAGSPGASPAGQYFGVAIFTTSGVATTTPSLSARVQ